jgi:hypothetical protein
LPGIALHDQNHAVPGVTPTFFNAKNYECSFNKNLCMIYSEIVQQQWHCAGRVSGAQGSSFRSRFVRRVLPTTRGSPPVTPVAWDFAGAQARPGVVMATSPEWWSDLKVLDMGNPQ